MLTEFLDFKFRLFVLCFIILLYFNREVHAFDILGGINSTEVVQQWNIGRNPVYKIKPILPMGLYNTRIKINCV